MYLPRKYMNFSSAYPDSILLALATIGFPNMIAALHWADEVLEKDGK